METAHRNCENIVQRMETLVEIQKKVFEQGYPDQKLSPDEYVDLSHTSVERLQRLRQQLDELLHYDSE